MKKYFVAFVLFAVTPSIAFASWWNPLSWNWTDLFSSPTQTVVQIPAATTSSEQILTENSTTTATTTIISIPLVATPTPPAIVPKKVIKRIPAVVAVQPITTQTLPIQTSIGCSSGALFNPMTGVSCTATTTSIVSNVVQSTSTSQSASSFAITSPLPNSLWKENEPEMVTWTPYTGEESDLINYQIVIGNTAANVSQQLFDNTLGDIANTQTYGTFPATKLLEEFSAQSGIPEGQINTDFYIQVNAVNSYASVGGAIVASTPKIPITIPIVPTVNVTAGATTIPSKTSTTISWTSTNATSCSLNISPLPSGGVMPGTVTTAGSLSTASLTVPTTYTVTCINGDNSVSGNVLISI